MAKAHRKGINRRNRTRITQRELARLLELNELHSERDRLRKDILRRMEQGADIEPGHLTTSLTITQTRKWTRELVAQVAHCRAIMTFDLAATSMCKPPAIIGGKFTLPVTRSDPALDT